MKSIATPLTFPDAFEAPWFWVVNVALSRDAFQESLGPRHIMEPQEGTGDSDWWAFQYPCGLRLLYSVNHDNDLGAVMATLPQPEHAARHIPFSKSDYTFPATADTAPNYELTLHHYSKSIDELNHLHDFQVFRMGDDGNEMKIGYPTSETDAKCLIAEFESHKHKQIYWLSSCNKTSQET